MGELAHLGYMAVGLLVLLIVAGVVLNLLAALVAWVIDGGWVVLLFAAWIAWGVLQTTTGCCIP